MKRVIFCLFLILLSATVFAQNLNPAPGFVRINGGTFTMGSPANEARRESDEIQRQVTISSFQMSRYPVTQREYQEVMGTNPSHFRGDNLPVEMVSWFDAIEYCNRRSQREGLTPAYTISGSGDNRTVTWNRNANGYRLPTEAEWEYACRAGTTTPWNTGTSITTDQANYNNVIGRTTPVDRYPANRWGLYDMHGNVWEWCWDLYGPYASGAQTNPTGAVSGDYRVLRGGSWILSVEYARSAFRNVDGPYYRDDFLGFRLARP
ncbi:MAG: formylglycine-generating enzyme family protein [Treponema sp.]|nr:formylglycine-generating enzyme family protein [Treponema sp.]